MQQYPPEGIHHYQQQLIVPGQMQRWEEFSLSMMTWVTEGSPNLYIDRLRFGPRYQRFYDDHSDHMPVQNLRERFPTSAAMKTYFFSKIKP